MPCARERRECGAGQREPFISSGDTARFLQQANVVINEVTLPMRFPIELRPGAGAVLTASRPIPAFDDQGADRLAAECMMHGRTTVNFVASRAVQATTDFPTAYAIPVVHD